MPAAIKAIQPKVKESSLQIAAANFLRPLMADGIFLFNHCPNEGKRSVAQGWHLKNQGMMPGFPDLDIDITDGDRIFIELKVPPNKLSDNQINCHTFLRALGYAVYTVSATNALECVNEIRAILREHGVEV